MELREDEGGCAYLSESGAWDCVRDDERAVRSGYLYDESVGVLGVAVRLISEGSRSDHRGVHTFELSSGTYLG